MAMNYVGSISILDRGDAPAQAVIDRNARSLAQRIADETKDELEKVMTRVETIYSSFEDTDQVYGVSNLEYLQDITELEELMKDQVKKKKYQQQVTIFIVGFSDVSGQKLRLLQQVNEFFTENSKEIDKEEWFPTTPDLDLEEVGDKIDDSLQVARDLGKRLGELNKEMVEYMANYAEKKASNKLTQLVEGKGKKKMEKALAQAREEVQTLAEKLLAVQTDLEEKDEKLQSTFKQLEMKNLEVQKFRTAAELAKKAVQDSEALQEQIAAQDAKLLEQRQQLNRMEMELAQSNHVKERSQTKLMSMGEESQQKIIMLQKELDEQKRTAEDAKRDLTKFHDEQLTALRGVHEQDMEEMKKQHAEQIKSLTADLQRVRSELASTQNTLLDLQLEKGVSETQSEVGKHFDLDSEEGTSRQSSKQESRPSTKDKSGRTTGAKKPGSKSPTRHPGGKDGKSSRTSSSGTNKEFAEVGIQDEGGDPSSALYEENKLKTPGTRHSRRSKSTLAPVEEFEDFEDVYDLSDEQSWASVPKDQIEGRFAQYRRLSQLKLREVEEQRQLTVAKTQRKVQLLKAQFVEHKNKWEAERKILIEQVEQAQQLQTDAEKEADQAMTQLEDFITEQERLEEEEEVRRSAILQRTSSSSLSPANVSPGGKTPLPPTTPSAAGAIASTHPTPPESRSTHNEEELQNLLQQTDDAKVEELKERLAGTKSAPPGVDMATTTAEQDQEDAAEGGKEQTSDMENVDGPSEEAAKQVALEELQDLPPIDSAAPDDASSPSIHPPPTAATMGSLPAHDQLETPLAEIASEDAAAYAKGDKDAGQSGGELKDDVSNLEKSRTDITEGTQGTTMTEKESTQVQQDGASEATADSTNASKVAQPSSKTPDTVFKIDGDTEDELREASARSRASLRSHYKNQLEESRQAAEDRRSKTPVITLPSKLSVDDELVLDDDDDDFDEEMALPDDLKEELEEKKRKEISMYEMGTSPPPGPGKDPSSHSVQFVSRKASTLVDHPLLVEYMKTYNGVATFKDTLSTLFLDKDMMSASQILADLETLVLDKEKKVMPQVEQFTANALFILEEIASVISSAVMVDREPPVSSLLPYSRDEMRSRLPPTREASEDVYPAYTHPKMVTPASASGMQQVFVNNVQDTSGVAVGDKGAVADGMDATVGPDTKVEEVTGRVSGGSVGGDVVMEGPPSEAGSQAGSLQGSRKSSVSGSTKQHLAELQAQCSVLQGQLEEESKKHEEQLRHNTVVMMEMQDTINELQRELSAIGKSSARKPRSATSSAAGLAKTPSPDQSLMFTRLDLERNAKIMKKAVLDQRLDADKYKEAVTTMDDYVSLPAQRLAHLVKKYVHHSRMKEIEENVKNSESLDEHVFDTLDKMEALQNQRARHWAEKMDMMGFERLRLAAMLMDSLDSIEQESGLFLIKPMYSYRGRELKAPPTQKLARPVRTQPVQRHQSAAQDSTTSFVPAPTPASNARRMERTHTPSHHQPAVDLTALPPPPPSRPEDGVVGAGAIRNIITPQAPQLVQSYQTWNMSASQARTPIDGSQHPLNTPRMLELDINRMLIGQNNVSTKLPHPPTDDRLVNASNNSLRSYVTVQRPTATLMGERPTSANAGGRETGAPPSSPSPRPHMPVSPADRDLPNTMTSPPPLPPIGDRTGSASSTNNDEPEPPQSPPGSSMYQSTMQDVEDGRTVKGITRTSSQLTTSLLTDDEED